MQNTAKPNLLWIFCDQLRWHSISANGDPNVETPNLDRLIAEGVSFDCAVTTSPICTPARGAAMTGQYCHTTDILYLGDLLPPSQRTIAHVFRDAGYRTGYVGKWHLASAQNPFGHNEGAEYWVHPKLRGGFEDWFGFELSNHFWETRYSSGESMWPPKKINGYQTDGLTDLSLNYLENTARKQDRPWFHVLSVEAPHHGRDDKGVAKIEVGERSHTRHPAPPEYEARFDPEDMKLRNNVPEEARVAARSQQAQYCAMIANLDDNVGQILSWLDETGLAENTLLCFFSDHGEMGGSHGGFQKGNPYDESIRIPMIMRFPKRLPTGLRVGQPANLVDLLPTCAALCGLPVPAEVQGINLSRFCAPENNDNASPREGTLIQFFGNPRYHPEGKVKSQWRALRTERYTYAISTDGWGMLFDNQEDPDQLRNLYDDPDYAECRSRLQKALIEEMLNCGEEMPASFGSR